MCAHAGVIFATECWVSSNPVSPCITFVKVQYWRYQIVLVSTTRSVIDWTYSTYDLTSDSVVAIQLVQRPMYYLMARVFFFTYPVSSQTNNNGWLDRPSAHVWMAALKAVGLILFIRVCHATQNDRSRSKGRTSLIVRPDSLFLTADGENTFAMTPISE